MQYKDILGKSQSEIYDTLYSIKKEQLGLRFQKSSDQMKDTAQIRRNRRDVARLMMRLSEVKNKVIRSS